MVYLKEKCLTKKLLSKVKSRILNKTKKNIKNIIKYEPEKYLTSEELYNLDCGKDYNDIINHYNKFIINKEKHKKNSKILDECDLYKNEAIQKINPININKIEKILNKKKEKHKSLINIGINEFIYEEIYKHQNYNDIKIKNFCKVYKLLDVNELSKQFDFFNIENIEFNTSNTLMSFCIDFIGNENYYFFVKDIYNKNIIKYIPLHEKNESFISLHDTLSNNINRQLSSQYLWIDNESIIYISYNKYYNLSKCYTYNIRTKKRRFIFEQKHKMLSLHHTYSYYYFILYSSTYNSDEIYLIDIKQDNFDTHHKKCFIIKNPIFKSKDYVEYKYIDHIDSKWYILKKDKNVFTFMKTFDFKNFNILFKKKKYYINIDDVYFINNYFVFFIKNISSYHIELFNICNEKLVKLNQQINICNDNNHCYLKLLNILQEKNKLFFCSSSFISKERYFCLEFNYYNKYNIIEMPQSKNKNNKYEEKNVYLKNNKIVITQIYKKGLKLNNCKCLLWGYGSYGISYQEQYDFNYLLTLCDQGFLVIIAHVSGDGILGYKQYSNGNRLKKKNTFYDFIYIIEEYLFKYNITSKEKLVIWGRSAGGLLISSVINIRPNICNLAILGVPFVMPLHTLTSYKSPLGIESHSEYGNPFISKTKQYISSYSPYENINLEYKYPNIFIYSNLYDVRVPYNQPLTYYNKIKNANVFKNNEKDIIFYMDDRFGHEQGVSKKDNINIFSIIFATINKYIH